MIALDDLDREIVRARMAEYDRRDGPRVGDFVDFADRTGRRVSHVWAADWHDDGIARVQTSDSGSFYLGGGHDLHDALNGHGEGAYVSFSGSLYDSVRADALTLTAERRDGRLWIFHGDQWGGGRGVDDVAAWRVYRSDQPAPK